MFKRLIDLVRKWYIVHEDVRIPSNGVAYFGPFRGWEMRKRLNDAYADLLADSGNLDAGRLSKRGAKTIYVNPRSYWMHQLKGLKELSK